MWLLLVVQGGLVLLEDLAEPVVEKVGSQPMEGLQLDLEALLFHGCEFGQPELCVALLAKGVGLLEEGGQAALVEVRHPLKDGGR